MTRVSARAWKPRPGRSKALIDAEQNKAAGGAYRRAVSVEAGGTTRGSIVLVAPEGRNLIRAYLRWSLGGRSASKSLGVVRNPTRMANLIDGWEVARSRGLIHDESPPPESWASSPEVRASMKGNRARDTGPERRLRSLLHARGLRYRVSRRPLPGLRRTADIVFQKARVAIFVDGCYWHGCPEHHRPATRNSTFWRTKIADNKRRDAETNLALTNEGWIVLRFWEHEDPAVVVDSIVSVLRKTTEN